MASGSFRFEDFHLDPDDRQLRQGDDPVELSGRYLDALALLVSQQGRLVSKDRFLDEVWRGVPVTDEALTQCIRTLRRQLGDDAASPRFIETVPRHGYRFIAPVERVGDGPRAELTSYSRRELLTIGAGGTVGGGLAGLLGGLFYGFAATASLAPGTGALSALVVLVCLSVLVALIGGAGVAFGIAAARFARGRPWLWTIVGGAIGGLAVGAFVNLVGLDAFNLLFGRAPGGITGATEGALLGGAVGFGAWLASRTESESLRRAAGPAAVAGGLAGLLIASLGGRLMGGSLDLLARHFPGSRLRLDQLGSLFGEPGFGPVTQLVTAALEGALFAGCVVAAMTIAERRLS